MSHNGHNFRIFIMGHIYAWAILGKVSDELLEFIVSIIDEVNSTSFVSDCKSIIINYTTSMKALPMWMCRPNHWINSLLNKDLPYMGRKSHYLSQKCEVAMFVCEAIKISVCQSISSVWGIYKQGPTCQQPMSCTSNTLHSIWWWPRQKPFLTQVYAISRSCCMTEILFGTSKI